MKQRRKLCSAMAVSFIPPYFSIILHEPRQLAHVCTHSVEYTTRAPIFNTSVCARAEFEAAMSIFVTWKMFTTDIMQTDRRKCFNQDTNHEYIASL